MIMSTLVCLCLCMFVCLYACSQLQWLNYICVWTTLWLKRHSPGFPHCCPALTWDLPCRDFVFNLIWQERLSDWSISALLAINTSFLMPMHSVLVQPGSRGATRKTDMPIHLYHVEDQCGNTRNGRLCTRDAVLSPDIVRTSCKKCKLHLCPIGTIASKKLRINCANWPVHRTWNTWECSFFWFTGITSCST